MRYYSAVLSDLLELPLDPILLLLLLRHAHHIVLFDLNFALAPLCSHDVSHDLICYQVLGLVPSSLSHAYVLWPAETQLLPQGVIVSDQREATAEQIFIPIMKRLMRKDIYCDKVSW